MYVSTFQQQWFLFAGVLAEPADALEVLDVAPCEREGGAQTGQVDGRGRSDARAGSWNTKLQQTRRYRAKI